MDKQTLYQIHPANRNSFDSIKYKVHFYNKLIQWNEYKAKPDCDGKRFPFSTNFLEQLPLSQTVK